jgi:probable HAF family extracellular repeat protein
VVGIAHTRWPLDCTLTRRAVVVRWMFVVLLVGLLSLAGVSQAGARQDDAAPRYTLTDLGTIKNFAATVGMALNEKGIVVGQAYDPDTFQSRAVIYRSSKLRALIKGEDQFASHAQDVNAGGQIIGADSEGAKLWESDEATEIRVPDRDTYVTAINDAGVVVGYSSDLDSETKHPFTWIDGEITELELLPDSVRGEALNINADGLVVGDSIIRTADVPEGRLPPRHAVLWEDGSPIDLGTLGGDYSLAVGINTSGQIVGASTTDPDQPELGVPGTHAVLWEDGEPTDLGTLADGEVSVASAINAGGDIVGRSSVAADSTGGENRAVLWHNGEIHDLNDLIDGGGDVVLENAYDINDSGLIIALGRVDGIEHSYLLEPIEA